MEKIIPPRYDIGSAEKKLYKLWQKSGYFNPDKLPNSGQRRPFSIVMPPNNANGLLHMGHAVGLTLQDVLIRFWRMRGKKTLWLPGADHAGFETQVVYDKKLDKEGRNRHEIPREQLWREIMDFTQENKARMYEQTKQLGSSCDWSRETFTLDPKVIKVVYETFERLYKDGLVYRDLRVINWCPKHRTALSDLEIKYVEREDPLYYIKYGPLTLATVRPETKFGDTALAVNPKDLRYKKYIGKEIEAIGVLGPLKFKVIADEAVDPKFGTGVVKVTPAHDPADFEIWSRHKNEIQGPKIIIDESGRLTGEVGEFKGLKVAEAREKMAARMEEIGILKKVEMNYKHQVGTCYKCGNILEPLPRPQWFVKMKPLAEPAIKAVKAGQIKIHPKHSEKVYLHWLKNIRDWNISRQIVWGIRIPAWFCLKCSAVKVNLKTKSKWYFMRYGEMDPNRDMRFPDDDIKEPLNENGIREVELAAKRIKDYGIDIIISSDALRAKQIAEIVAKKAGLKIIFDENLMERAAGSLKGRAFEDIKKEYGRNYWTDSKVIAPGFETLEELETRVWKAFIARRKEYENRNVLVVGHGAALRILKNKLKELEIDEAWKMSHMANAEIVQVDVGEKCNECGGDLYEQDPDVFDTWFSSGQWPFATLMKSSSDFKNFYPTSVMETGYDILFFWVARMIMLGIYRTGKLPFKNVYLHGLVRDKDRQKMSKSKGNVIDPLGVAEVYGADAVRMALISGNTAGNDIVISEEKIKGYRNFATKIWNVARLVMMNRKSEFSKIKPLLSSADKKDIAKLKKIRTEITRHLENFEFHLAAEKLYHYLWHEFADKVVEETKPRLNSENTRDAAAAYYKLELILLDSIKMIHPFMPFVTEEVWQKFRPKTILMVEQWPR